MVQELTSTYLVKIRRCRGRRQHNCCGATAMCAELPASLILQW